MGKEQGKERKSNLFKSGLTEQAFSGLVHGTVLAREGLTASSPGKMTHA